MSRLARRAGTGIETGSGGRHGMYENAAGGGHLERAAADVEGRAEIGVGTDVNVATQRIAAASATDQYRAVGGKFVDQIERIIGIDDFLGFKTDQCRVRRRHGSGIQHHDRRGAEASNGGRQVGARGTGAGDFNRFARQKTCARVDHQHTGASLDPTLSDGGRAIRVRNGNSNVGRGSRRVDAEIDLLAFRENRRGQRGATAAGADHVNRIADRKSGDRTDRQQIRIGGDGAGSLRSVKIIERVVNANRMAQCVRL